MVAKYVLPDQIQTTPTHIYTDSDNIRVATYLLGLSDLPNLKFWDGSDAYGWWELEGSCGKDFNGPYQANLKKMDIQELENHLKKNQKELKLI